MKWEKENSNCPGTAVHSQSRVGQPTPLEVQTTLSEQNGTKKEDSDKTSMTGKVGGKWDSGGQPVETENSDQPSPPDTKSQNPLTSSRSEKNWTRDEIYRNAPKGAL